MDNTTALDQIIRTATIAIDPVVYSEGEICFPGLYRYIFDEDGHPHQCPNN